MVARQVNARLQHLRAAQCARLTDESLTALSTNCSELLLLDVSFDFLLSPAALSRLHHDLPALDLIWDSLDR
jgi:hypothetical protein